MICSSSCLSILFFTPHWQFSVWGWVILYLKIIVLIPGVGGEILLLGLQPTTSSVATKSDPSISPGFLRILGAPKLGTLGTSEPWGMRICSTITPILPSTVPDLLTYYAYLSRSKCGMTLTPCQCSSKDTTCHSPPLPFLIGWASPLHLMMVKKSLFFPQMNSGLQTRALVSLSLVCNPTPPKKSNKLLELH